MRARLYLTAVDLQVSLGEVGGCTEREEEVSSDGHCSPTPLGASAAEKGTVMYSTRQKNAPFLQNGRTYLQRVCKVRLSDVMVSTKHTKP